MTMRNVAVAAAIFAATALTGQSAQALTMQECSAKYKAAQAAGTTNGLKWNDFRKAQCGSDAAPAPAAATTTTPAPAPAPAPAAPPAKQAATPPAKQAAPAPAPSAAAGNAVFPTAIAPKYASEKPGQGRKHTCLDQYNANKESNGNGGLVWITKGGGYYSECNKRLKG